MRLYEKLDDNNQTEIVEGVTFLLNSLNENNSKATLPDRLLSFMRADSVMLAKFEQTLYFIFGSNYEKFDGTFFVFNKSYYDTDLYSDVAWCINNGDIIYKNSHDHLIAKMLLCFDDDTNECFLINFYTMFLIIHPRTFVVDGGKDPYFEANWPMGYHKYSGSIKNAPFDSYYHGAYV